MTPLANEFVPASDRGRPQDQFPLEICLCERCGHVQLRDVVDPQRLFRNYVYVSSTSPVFVDHFRRYAQALLGLTNLAPGSTVVEIGSNDGALLQCFKDAGMRVLGIDPARAIAAQASGRGVNTLPEFFTRALAQQLSAQGWAADVIAANNVFAHADDLHDIAEGVAQLLTPDGVFVFEVSYLLDVVEKTLFDTIYHEHVSYHTVAPLVGFFERHGLELIDAIRVDTHGGSLRGIVKRRGGRVPRQASVEELIRLERARGLNRPEAYERLAQTIQQRKAELVSLLRQLRSTGKRIVGFGAPAKATTLMFACGIEPGWLECIVDESPWKQGLYSPGHHLPVVAPEILYDGAARPDYALILAWNFAESIMSKHRAFLEGGGHFIVPLPTVVVH
jgi:SAM-dependent methyltransferase